MAIRSGELPPDSPSCLSRKGWVHAFIFDLPIDRLEFFKGTDLPQERYNPLSAAAFVLVFELLLLCSVLLFPTTKFFTGSYLLTLLLVFVA